MAVMKWKILVINNRKSEMFSQSVLRIYLTVVLKSRTIIKSFKNTNLTGNKLEKSNC